MDLRKLAQLNAEATARAMQDQKQPFRFFNVAEVDNLTTFPFPKLGDFIPEGWELVDEWFCDKTGLGEPWEPALTRQQLNEKIKWLIAEHGIDNVGFGLGLEGQFQVYVRVFGKI